MSDIGAHLFPDTMETDFRSHCPICGRNDFGSLTNHLQAHSKQALIDVLVNKREGFVYQHLKPQPTDLISADVFGNEDGEGIIGHGHGHSGRRSVSPPKKSLQRGASHSRRRSTATGRDRDSRHAASAGSQQPSTSRVAIDAITGNEHGGTLVYEVEIQNVGVHTHDPETTEIMPVPICSFSLPPACMTKTRGDEKHSESGFTHLHVLCPMRETEQISDITEIPKSDISHSNFIKYIIDETGSGNRPVAKREEPTKWILPGGMTIPVYSSFTNIPSSSRNSQESHRSSRHTTDESSSSLSNFNERLHSSTHQSDVDLMTDEEIPPRGEISEYEESNTSSHQSDELNKPGVISIGSSLGSLFSDVRRLSPGIDLDSIGSASKRKISPTLKPTQLPTLAVMSTKGPITGPHKCPDPDCSQVGSIFELAQHQEKVHHKMYNKPLRKTTPQESSSQSLLMIKAIQQRETKPVISVIQDRANLPERINLKDYRCLYCDFFTKKKKVIDTHMETSHPDKPAMPTEYECTTCGKVFQKRANLIKHLLIHGGKRHKCALCAKAFTSKFKLGEHIRVHTKDYPFKCSECERSFRTPSLRKAHLARCHPKPGDVKPVVQKLELYCTICHRVLHSKRSLTSHLKLHSQTSKKCTFCPEVFPRNSVLIRHIRMTHDPCFETKESKDCPICWKKLHPNSMKSHMRIHNNEKPYSCTVCSKTFRTYANQLSHSWNHTNADKPFKCKICSKSYLFNKSLETHMIVHKKRTFHFVCNECGMKFTSKVNMKRHSEEHFSEKKYKCGICLKAFHRKYYLTEHERIHNGAKPFSCTICGKASSTKSNHRAHVKIHDARESGSLEN